MTFDTSAASRFERIALAGMIALALILHLTRISADLPARFEGTGAAQLDAFWYTGVAAAAADGSRYEPAGPYDLPLWTAIARAWFAVFGAGVGSVNLLGAMASLLAIGLVFVVVSRAMGQRTGSLAAAVLAFAHPFLVFGRSPLIYGPVATLLVLSAGFWLEGLANQGWRRSALLLAGIATLATTGFLFKAVGFVLAPALLASAATGTGRRAKQVAGVGVLALALALGVVALFDPLQVWSSNRDRFLHYWTASGMSPLGLLRRVLLLGGDIGVLPPAVNDPLPRWVGSGFLRTSPVAFVLACLGAEGAWRDRRWLSARARTALTLAVAWIAAFVLLAAPLDYRPLRFFALVGPPMAILASFALAQLLGVFTLAVEHDRPPPPQARRWHAAVVFVLTWFASSHLLSFLRDLAMGRVPGVERERADAVICWVGAIVAVHAAVFVKPSTRARAAVPVLGWGLLVAFLAVDLPRDLSILAEPATIARTNSAMRTILGEQAVLAGPYAPALAIGSRVERRPGQALEVAGLPAMLAAITSAGYTHVAIDAEQDRVSHFSAALAAAGRKTALVAEFRIRGYAVQVRRLSSSQANGYVPSAYENSLEATGAALPPLEPAAAVARIRALLSMGRRSEAVAALVSDQTNDAEVAALRAELGLGR